MTEIRRTKPLTALLATLLECEVPEAMRLKLAGLRADGARKKGRPKKGTIELCPRATFGDAVILSLVCRALSGDTFAIKLVFAYLEGLPSRAIHVSGGFITAPVSIAELREKLLALAGDTLSLEEKIAPHNEEKHDDAGNSENVG